MAREQKAAAEIQAEVARLIHKTETVAEDKATIKVPRPTRCEPDASGCNWTMMIFGGDARSYPDVIRHALKTVAEKWNLSD